MRAAVVLGLRLAGAGAGWARVRSALMALATAIGTLLMLTIVAIADAEQAQHAMLYDSPQMRRLLAAIVLSVALPVLVLVATAGRLSAQLRDRRLANLRLLGLTPLQTRAVAAVEAATAAVAGLVVGRLLFVGVRLLLPHLHVAGRSWTAAALAPPAVAQVAVLGGVLTAVVAVAVLPQRLSMTSALARARRDDSRRLSLLRVLPLLVGIVLCTSVIIRARPYLSNDSDSAVLAFFAGVVLLGTGLLLTVPALVRLLADLLLRAGPGPVRTVAARRLQAQPAGVTRVVSGLLIGLFLVTGARGVVAAFESTPQYQQEARQLDEGQRVDVRTTVARAHAVRAGAERVRGVRRVARLPVLATAGPCRSTGCLRAIVASCATLRVIAPGVAGCRDGQPMWLDSASAAHRSPARSLTWLPVRDERPMRSARPVAHTAVPRRSLHGDAPAQLQPASAVVLVPPSALAGTPLPGPAQVDLLVLGSPGRDLLSRLDRHHLTTGGVSYYAFNDYDQATALRAIVWAVAAVILAVGLLAFAVSVLDRAVSRRREVVSLQLVGVPRSLLRRAQWIEAGLPIAVGTLLAIGLGLFAGATYLALGGEPGGAPFSQALALAGIAVLSALLIAGVTVLGTNPRIRADLIRAE